MIQGTGMIAFLIKNYWRSNTSIPLLRENLATPQLETRRGGSILEKDYTGTKQWLHKESWILEVWKLISAKQLNISHLGPEVVT